MFHQLLPKTRVTSTGLIVMDTLKNLSVKNVPYIVICRKCGSQLSMCFSLFTLTSIHSIRKIIRNSQELGNELEVDRIFKA